MTTLKRILCSSTIRKIQRVLNELFSINLSVGAISENLHQTGLAAEPITDQLKQELAILKARCERYVIG